MPAPFEMCLQRALRLERFVAQRTVSLFLHFWLDRLEVVLFPETFGGFIIIKNYVLDVSLTVDIICE